MKAAALAAAVMLLAGCMVQADFRMSCKGKDAECNLEVMRKAEGV